MAKKRFCNGDHVLNDAPWVPRPTITDQPTDQRSGEDRKKPLNAVTARPIVVEILEGLCSAVGVVWLMMMMILWGKEHHNHLTAKHPCKVSLSNYPHMQLQILNLFSRTADTVL
jgi:hypothetical protein